MTSNDKRLWSHSQTHRHICHIETHSLAFFLIRRFISMPREQIFFRLFSVHRSIQCISFEFRNLFTCSIFRVHFCFIDERKVKEMIKIGWNGCSTCKIDGWMQLWCAFCRSIFTMKRVHSTSNNSSTATKAPFSAFAVPVLIVNDVPLQICKRKTAFVLLAS